MADTPRTRVTLIGTNFVTGQVAGIGSNDIRDFLVSVAPHYAAADPTVNDDINAASPGPYGIGLTWVNTTSGARFICKDNTDGAAVWKNVVGVYFLEAESVASPNNTVSVNSLVATGATTSVDLALVPKGFGAFLLDIPNDATSGGNKRGSQAVDLQLGRDESSQVASGEGSLAGNFGNTASGVYSTSFGYSNSSTGDRSFTTGQGNIAAGSYSSGSGLSSHGNKYGQESHASGAFAVVGDAQTSTLRARNSTTNATPAELFLDGASLRCTIPTDTTWAFRITVVGRRTDADNESFGQTHEGVIDNNAGTTAIAGTIVNVPLANEAALWVSAVTADNMNDALVITVTGENSKTIRWVARIELTEVTG